MCGPAWSEVDALVTVVKRQIPINIDILGMGTFIEALHRSDTSEFQFPLEGGIDLDAIHKSHL